jgi:hypothetical protein
MGFFDFVTHCGFYFLWFLVFVESGIASDKVKSRCGEIVCQLVFKKSFSGQIPNEKDPLFRPLSPCRSVAAPW